MTQQGCEARVPQVRVQGGAWGAEETVEEKQHEAQAKQPGPGEAASPQTPPPPFPDNAACSPWEWQRKQSLAW